MITAVVLALERDLGSDSKVDRTAKKTSKESFSFRPPLKHVYNQLEMSIPLNNVHRQPEIEVQIDIQHDGTQD